MKTVPLGEVAKFASGGTPDRKNESFYKGVIPWITGADIDDEGHVNARLHITEQAVQKSATKITSENSLLLVTRTAVGKTLIPPHPVSFSQDLTAINPYDNLDLKYLSRFLQSRSHYFEQHSRGATIKGVTRQVVENLSIPLPPLEEQRRIAAILDKADAIRQKRRQAIVHLESLTQSIFQNMFGELPVETPFGDVVKRFRNGVSPSNSGTAEANVLTLSAITQGRFDETQSKRAMFDSEPTSDKRVSSDDLLICRGNGNKSLVGAAEYSQIDLPELVFPDTIIAAQVDFSAASIAYLHSAWKHSSSRRQIESKARTTNGTYKINQAALSQVKIALPPTSDQDQFHLATRGIDGTKRLHHNALRASDSVFASLQSRAFRGEL